MMDYTPLVRIAIRYGVGLFLGNEFAEALAADADVVNYAAMAVGAAIGVANEYYYKIAKQKGWAT